MLSSIVLMRTHFVCLLLKAIESAQPQVIWSPHICFCSYGTARTQQIPFVSATSALTFDSRTSTAWDKPFWTSWGGAVMCTVGERISPRPHCIPTGGSLAITLLKTIRGLRSTRRYWRKCSRVGRRITDSLGRRSSSWNLTATIQCAGLKVTKKYRLW